MERQTTMRTVSLLLMLFCLRAALGQYRLEAAPSRVLEDEREAQRTFGEWPQRDQSLLRDVLLKSPDEARQIVVQAAQAAQRYTAAQTRYFQSLQNDVLRDIADLQSRPGVSAGSIEAQRNQIDKQLIN